MTELLPDDSCLHLWRKAYSIVETPVSYVMACGMASLGACLKRQTFVNQGRWKVYPNMSVLLVGPSGLGKDTAINEAKKFLAAMGVVGDAYGKTMERVFENLLNIGDETTDTPAAAYIIASELTAFLGGKDYQKSMVQELTDLLSTNEHLDVSLKSTKEKRVIYKPTITMFAGSTESWLHKAMPTGSLDGGLFPRFLVVCEESYEAIQRPVAFPLFSNPPEEVRESNEALIRYYDTARGHIEKFYRHPQEMALLPSARAEYECWYNTRMRFFSKAVEPYANRSRDQVHRLAMICAASRGHSYIEVEDYKFAISVMNQIASKIESAVRPPTKEAQIGQKILKLLPAQHKEIMVTLSREYTGKEIMEAITTLMQTGQMKRVEGGEFVGTKF